MSPTPGDWNTRSGHNRRIVRLSLADLLQRLSTASFAAGLVLSILAVMSTVPIVNRWPFAFLPMMDTRAALPYLAGTAVLSFVLVPVLRKWSKIVSAKLGD